MVVHMSHDPGPASTAEEQLARSTEQFGANAQKYTRSAPHAKGASLKRLPELVDAQANWHALDIATGGGHCALAFAEQVESVVASDATPQMLEAAAGLAAERGLMNVTFEPADAHDLPFDDATFDLVTCRIAPHHFSDPATFVSEAARVLKPGGTFGLVDNIAPEDPEAAVWCDDFERRRDPSHARCLPMTEWATLIAAAGLEQRHAETMGKKMDFAGWADNMSVPADTRAELLDDLRNAPTTSAEWLTPNLGPDGGEADTWFVLTECIIVATKP